MDASPLLIVLLPLLAIGFVLYRVFKTNRRIHERLVADDGGAVWDPQTEIERLDVENNTLRAENFELRKAIEILTPQRSLQERIERIEKHLGFDLGPYRASQRPPTSPIKQPRPGTIEK